MTTAPSANKAKTVVNPYLRDKQARPRKPDNLSGSNSSSNNKLETTRKPAVASALPSSQPQTTREKPAKALIASGSVHPKNSFKSREDVADNKHNVKTAASTTILPKERQQPPKSLKSKLKAEIENLKRATLLDQQQKLLRREQKALEKKRREQERLLAIEDAKRRKQQQRDEEQRRQLMLEQEKLQQERLRLEVERQTKQQEEEERQRQQQRLLQQLQQQQQQGAWAFLQNNQASLSLYGFPNHSNGYSTFAAPALATPRWSIDSTAVPTPSVQVQQLMQQQMHQPLQNPQQPVRNIPVTPLTQVQQQPQVSYLLTASPSSKSNQGSSGMPNVATKPNAEINSAPAGNLSMNLEMNPAHEITGSNMTEQSPSHADHSYATAACSSLVTPITKLNPAEAAAMTENIPGTVVHNDDKGIPSGADNTSQAHQITPNNKPKPATSSDAVLKEALEAFAFGPGTPEHPCNDSSSEATALTENNDSGAEGKDVVSEAVMDEKLSSLEAQPMQPGADVNAPSPVSHPSGYERHAQPSAYSCHLGQLDGYPIVPAPVEHAHLPALSLPPWYPPYSGQYPFPPPGQYHAPHHNMSNYHTGAPPQWHYAPPSYSNFHPQGYPGYLAYPRSHSFPEATLNHLYSQPTKKPRKPREPKPPNVERLALKPIEYPSPYERNYTLWTQTLGIVKKAGESFGVILREDKISALVEPERMLENQVNCKNTAVTPGDAEATASSGKQCNNCEEKIDQNEAKDQERKPASSTGDSKEKALASDVSKDPGACPSPLVGKETMAALGDKTMSVEPQKPMVTSNLSLAHLTGTSKAGSVPQKPSRTRRKRHFFAVLMVEDASVQNGRNECTMHLQQGDIILSVNGVATGGHFFREACTLFTKGGIEKDDENGEKLIQCSLTIARRRTPEPLESLRIVNITSTPALTSSLVKPLALEAAPVLPPLAAIDIHAFAETLVKAAYDSRRLLGAMIPGDLLRAMVGCSPRLAGRDLSSLKEGWVNTTSKIEKNMSEAASSFWTKQWRLETEKYPSRTSKNPISDAQRAKMRSAPRPATGCRCKGKDHSFVYDTQCPLYTDLLPLSNWESNSRTTTEKSTTSGDLDRPLKAVETAFKERFLKLQREREAEEEEAMFVEEMERCQVQQLRKAIFAPSLTAMVLSVVFELQSAFPADGGSKNGESHPGKDEVSFKATTVGEGKGDCYDDEDDIPLAALGKRVASSSQPSTRKKQREGVEFRAVFLAKLLSAISNRWGHLYQEPTDVDYAWRWETYHGQMELEAGKWEAQSTNPRKEGSLSFENIRFLLNDAFMGRLMAEPDGDESTHVALAYLVSVERTGVLDELLALQRSGILNVKGGVPRPSKDWYIRAGPNLLNEMEESWKPEADRGGKYCVFHKLRSKLDETWVVSDPGWTLREDPDEVIYDLEEWAEWRVTLEEKHEAHEEDANGIGRFGL